MRSQSNFNVLILLVCNHQVNKSDNLGVNRSNLKRLAEFLFTVITDSVPRVPLAVTLVCHGVVRFWRDQKKKKASKAFKRALKRAEAQPGTRLDSFYLT